MMDALASEAIIKDMGKCITWHLKNWGYNHNKPKHNKTLYILYGYKLLNNIAQL